MRFDVCIVGGKRGDAVGRHVSVPPRIEEYLALRMFNQIAEHREPYPLRFRGCYTGCFDDAAIVAAKGQIRRYSYLACPQNVYLYLFHDFRFLLQRYKNNFE